jgi:hypothetical protein
MAVSVMLGLMQMRVAEELAATPARPPPQAQQMPPALVSRLQLAQAVAEATLAIFME